MTIPFRQQDILLIILLSVLLALQIIAAWSFTIDDMYITLRYAKHWVGGLGLLWNSGEPPVEGYSNFSFVVLASISLLLHVDPVLMLKCAGVCGLCGQLLVLYRVARVWLPPTLAFWPCIWLSAYRGEILWSVSGLETSVYQLLLTLGVLLLLQARNSGYLWAGISFAVAAMTRPEAPLLAVLCVVLLAHQAVTTRQVPLWSGLTIFIMAFGVCFLPYLLWKWHYYGQLLPNPVYCKALLDWSDWRLDAAYLRLLAPFLLAATPALLGGLSGPNLIWLWAPSVVYLLLCYGADPIVAFENRLFLPAWALFLPCSVLGLQQCCTKPWQINAACGLLLLSVPMFSWAQYRYYTRNPVAGEQLRASVAEWLEQHTAAQDTVVLADSGLIPYRSALRFKDSYCLNNKKMAELPRATRISAYCQQVLSAKPEVIILTAEVRPTGLQYTPVDACLFLGLEHNILYTKQAQFQSKTAQANAYRYSIFTRSDRD